MMHKSFLYRIFHYCCSKLSTPFRNNPNMRPNAAVHLDNTHIGAPLPANSLPSNHVYQDGSCFINSRYIRLFVSNAPIYWKYIWTTSFKCCNYRTVRAGASIPPIICETTERMHYCRNSAASFYKCDHMNDAPIQLSVVLHHWCSLFLQWACTTNLLCESLFARNPYVLIPFLVPSSFISIPFVVDIFFGCL